MSSHDDNIFQPLRDFLNNLAPRQHLIVAYSGGVDSSVLLHALWRLKPAYDYQLSAVHIHHGLCSAAGAWVAHCQQICQDLDIPLDIKYLRDKANKGESIEAWARDCRREIFAAYLSSADKLVVTAQHQNDQAETLLLQLLRGSGGRGLAAMPMQTPMAQGFLARPLLRARRRDILAYAQTNGLHWIEDDSNQELQFDRNYLRQQLWPLIEQRWPAAAATIARSAELLASQNRVLDRYCEQQLPQLSNPTQAELPLDSLLHLDEESIFVVLRYWLRRHGVTAPPAKRLQAGVAMLLGAGASANPCLEWGQHRLSRFRHSLYLHHALPALPTSISLQVGQSFQVEGVGQFCLEAGFPGFQLDSKAELQIRFRRGGERLALRPAGPHRALKNLFQEWAVLPWLRSRIPLLYQNEQLVAVGDLAVAAEFQAQQSDNSYRLRRLSFE